MLEIPLYTADGQPSGAVQIDPQILGGKVRSRLLKQAIVAHLANSRQNTSATRNRSQVVGSTRKLFRQKGTGRARMGTVRTNIRRGGGVAFAKGAQDFTRRMNKKARRLARNNAVLAKIESNNALVVEDLQFDQPSTKRLLALLRAVGADSGCLLALGEPDESVYRSGRNLPKTDVRVMGELHAYDVLRRKKLIMTRPGFEALVSDPIRLTVGSSAGEDA